MGARADDLRGLLRNCAGFLQFSADVRAAPTRAARRWIIRRWHVTGTHVAPKSGDGLTALGRGLGGSQQRVVKNIFGLAMDRLVLREDAITSSMSAHPIIVEADYLSGAKSRLNNDSAQTRTHSAYAQRTVTQTLGA